MILWDLPAWIVWTYLFVLGAVVGSFLNVCVYRLPLHEEIWAAWKGLVHPPSSCPACRQPIQLRDNVPILGWLLLRGRCRSCRHRISIRYPVIEFLNGALFVGLYVMMVPAGFHAELDQSCVYSALSPLEQVNHFRDQSLWLNLQYVYYLFLVEALFVASLIDLDLQIIPDSVTVPAMVVGFLGSLTGMFYLMPVWVQNPSLVSLLWSLFVDPGADPPAWAETAVPQWCSASPQWHGFAVSLAGFLVGGGVVWFVRIAGEWVFRREAMGFGDVILMAMIGSFLGWQPTLVVFFLAPVCALATVAITSLFARRREIPFGPYLSLAALLVILFWQPLYPATAQFFTLGPFVPVLAAILAVALVAVLWLVQGIKWLLGIPLYEDDWIGDWTSADQLTFFASKERTDGTRGLARTEWPGVAAGQGLTQRNRWLGR